MKTLIVEDEFTSRLLLQEFLKNYGPSHIAVTGKEALLAVNIAIQTDEPYNLICLDIMMPEMNGQEALSEIRRLEETKGITGPSRSRIIMTTSLADKDNVIKAHAYQCDAYLIKPIDKAKLLEELHKFKLIK
jgi:two-component system, chemotaxis family, chemotaxis protein CheY